MVRDRVPTIKSIVIDGNPNASAFVIEAATTERAGGFRSGFAPYRYLPDGSVPTFATAAEAEREIRQFVRRWTGWHAVDVRITGLY
jgi:hypothetical protein